jgi:alpha-L-rhamnosidase
VPTVCPNVASSCLIGRERSGDRPPSIIREPWPLEIASWRGELSGEIVRRFWDDKRGLLADDQKHTSFSEHAQCLALLNGVLPKHKEAACFKALIETKDLHRATVYFSFYLFETLKKFDRGDLIVDRLSFWQDLLKGGFKTTL